MDPTSGKLFGAIGPIEHRPALFAAEVEPDYARWYSLQWRIVGGFAKAEDVKSAETSPLVSE